MVAKYGIFHSVTVNVLKDGNPEEVGKSATLVKTFLIDNSSGNYEFEKSKTLSHVLEWFKEYRIIVNKSFENNLLNHAQFINDDYAGTVQIVETIGNVSIMHIITVNPMDENNNIVNKDGELVENNEENHEEIPHVEGEPIEE